MPVMISKSWRSVFLAIGLLIAIPIVAAVLPVTAEIRVSMVCAIPIVLCVLFLRAKQL